MRGQDDHALAAGMARLKMLPTLPDNLFLHEGLIHGPVHEEKIHQINTEIVEYLPGLFPKTILARSNMAKIADHGLTVLAGA